MGVVRFMDKKTRFDSEGNILYFDMKRQNPDWKEVFSAIEIKFLTHDVLLSLIEIAGFELQDRYANWLLSPFDTKGSNGVFKL